MRLKPNSRRAALAVVTGLLLAPATAVAQGEPSPEASCGGTLSSFAGQAGIRQDFAPGPGADVAAFAHRHEGDVFICFFTR